MSEKMTELGEDIDTEINLDKLGEMMMKGIAITLIIVGVLGLLLSFMMYGDIAVAGLIGSIGALLSGFNFLILDKKMAKVTNE